MRKPRSLFLAGTTLAIALVIASIAATRLTGDGDGPNDLAIEVRTSDAAIWMPPPDSVEEFAQRMSVVVVGHYEDIVEVREAARLQGAPAGAAGAVPITLMNFKVSEYVVGTGPGTLIVGQYGDFLAGYSMWGVPPPEFGTEITLIAVQWSMSPSLAVAIPVGSTYGRLVERNGVVEYAFVTPDLAAQFPAYSSRPFAIGLTLGEVHEGLQEAARKRGLFVPD
jgi:hypothetical protein